MNKNVLYALMGLAGAGVAYLVYRYMQTPTQAYSPTSMSPYSDGDMILNDHAQTYPFRANTPPRVDNSNQPWANNNRAAISQVSAPQIDVNLSNAQMIASYAKSAASLTESLTSIWEDFGVGDWFSDDDAMILTEDVSFDNLDFFSGSGFSESQFGDYA